MPTYEFVCTGCGHFLEVRASLAEKDAGLAPTCRACGSGAVKRTFSAVALVGARPASTGEPQTSPGGCCGGGCGCG